MNLLSATPLLLAAALSTAAAAAGNFGDAVADCLAKKGITQAGPVFDAALPSCEAEVERSRRRTAIEDAKTSWQVCLAKAISDIDDGVSTASDIATAVQGDCEKEYEAFLDSTSLSSPVKAKEWQRRRDTTRELATTLTLKVRQWKASEGRPESP